LAIALPALLIGIVDPQRVIAIEGDDAAGSSGPDIRRDLACGCFEHCPASMLSLPQRSQVTGRSRVPNISLVARTVLE
jgi:hypothetical protein